MSPERLLQNFDRLIDTPDAVPRLRRFILDLAVRGKLVEQNPEDEPAWVLLKRIETEKARLEKVGTIRPSKSITLCDEPEHLFSLPKSWLWVRLGEVGSIIGGGTPPSKDSSCFTEGGKGVAWLTPADLGKHNSLFISHGQRDLTEKGLSNCSTQLMPTGSVLFTSRAPIGYIAIAVNKITTNQGFKSVVPYIIDSNRYIAVYFKAFAPWIDGKASGTTFKEVSGKIVSNIPFPLPPLAEQHRIVAKVDELMALCDELEAAQAKRERRRDRLVAATLHGLNNGDSESATSERFPFEESARFYFNHLPRLTTRPEHIKQLRQTILNLAVRGKLVEQNPEDEPAAELLKRIEVEKTRLIKEGKIRKDKPLSLTEEETRPFGLPTFWEWVPIRKITTDRGQKIPDKKFSYIDVSAIDKERGKIGEPLVLTPDAAPSRARKIVQQGDVIYSCVRPYLLNIAVVDKDFKPEPIVSTAFVVLNGLGFVLPQYLWIVLRSPYFVSCVEEKMRGQAYPAINDNDFAPLPVPLPPLAEQHRVVAKVDELMALCDELEKRIDTTSITRRQLLEATLQEVLSSGALTNFFSFTKRFDQVCP